MREKKMTMVIPTKNFKNICAKTTIPDKQMHCLSGIKIMWFILRK